MRSGHPRLSGDRPLRGIGRSAACADAPRAHIILNPSAGNKGPWHCDAPHGARPCCDTVQCHVPGPGAARQHRFPQVVAQAVCNVRVATPRRTGCSSRRSSSLFRTCGYDAPRLRVGSRIGMLLSDSPYSELGCPRLVQFVIVCVCECAGALARLSIWLLPACTPAHLPVPSCGCERAHLRGCLRVRAG